VDANPAVTAFQAVHRGVRSPGPGLGHPPETGRRPRHGHGRHQRPRQLSRQHFCTMLASA
jgi:hypothetical protein